MDELKRMLEAIHKENKDIMFLLCLEDEMQTDEDFCALSNEIDERYDSIFYGKENTDERIKN